MTILYHPAAVRELEKVPIEIRKMILRSLEEFHMTKKGDIRHIRGEVWSLRVGEYRVYFKTSAEDLLVGGVDHRKHAYIPERVEALKKRLERA